MMETDTLFRLSRWKQWAGYAWVALPAVALLLLYRGTLSYPLVFDDEHFFFTSPAFRECLDGPLSFDRRWVSCATYRFTYKFFSGDLRWYHLGNVALHALTVSALAVFLCRLYTAALKPWNIAVGPRRLAVLGAFVFACHPVTVYAVAYLIQRTTLLATLFGILMLHCYVEGLARQRAVWFAAAAGFYALAVSGKEHAVMLPAVAVAITLLLRTNYAVHGRRLWLPYTLFIAIAVAAILQAKGILGGTIHEEVLAYDLQHGNVGAASGQLSSAMPGYDAQDAVSPGVGFAIQNALALSILNQGYLFFRYLLIWLVPNADWMSVDLRVPLALRFSSWPELAGLAGYVVYGGVALRLLLLGGARGLFGFGMIFPWVLFATEFSTVRFQEPFVLYRSYLWMSGLPAALPLLARNCSARLTSALLVILCLALLPLTAERLRTFSSEFALWDDAVKKQRNDKAYGAARAYVGRGKQHFANGRFRESVSDLSKAIELSPGYSTYYRARAVSLVALAQEEAAAADFQRAIEIAPHDAENYLGRCYFFIVYSRFNEEIADCDKAIALDPRNPRARANRKEINERLFALHARLQGIRSHLRENPGDAKAYISEGMLLRSLQNNADARESFDKSCKLGDAIGCEQAGAAP